MIDLVVYGHSWAQNKEGKGATPGLLDIHCASYSSRGQLSYTQSVV